MKRALDVVFAALGLMISFPVIVVVYALVRVRLGKPVLFRQKRAGLHGRTFEIVKFRTMLPMCPGSSAVTNEERMTSLGSALRKTSLDELPTLWNVLRGDMSIVGPRPLRTSYVERYSEQQALRHMVRPGITGLAQVQGRNSLSWDDRLEIDQQYVRERDLWLDLRIVFKTVSTVVSRKGIQGEGDGTMGEFFGPMRTETMEFVRLREEHLETRVKWLNNPSVRSGISIDFEATLEGMTKWFGRKGQTACRYDWVGVDRGSGAYLSMCGITLLENGDASLYVYVSPERQGEGHGKATMSLLISHARALGVRKLVLESPQDNSRAINLYRSLGFLSESYDGPKVHMHLPLASGHTNELS